MSRRASKRPPPKSTAPGAANKAANPLQGWLRHHGYVFFFTLGQLSRNLFSSLLTIAVIGIALALPTGLYVLLENARQLSASWEGSVQISLFLHYEISDAQAEEIATQLRLQPLIGSVQVITRAQALEEYRQLSGFSQALEVLHENPLPAVLVVKPRLEIPAQIQDVLARLQQLPQVDIAQYDMHWLKRLFAIMDLVRQGILMLAAILALAVVLIVGNTIRLAIDNRKEEIEITKLFGATDAFIRRPFLYLGLWYGLGGAVCAWLLVQLSIYALQGPILSLTLLYHTQFSLVRLDGYSSLVLLLCGIILGLSGAWLAVALQLHKIEPK